MASLHSHLHTASSRSMRIPYRQPLSVEAGVSFGTEVAVTPIVLHLGSYVLCIVQEFKDQKDTAEEDRFFSMHISQFNLKKT